MSASRPKLLFVVTEDWYFVSHRLSLARVAVEDGFEVAVATRISTYRDRIEASGIRVIPFEMGRRSVNPAVELQTIWRLAALYRRLQPDIVHHVSLKPVLLGSMAAKLSGTKHVVNAITGFGFLFSEESRHPLVKALIQRALPSFINGSAVIVQNPDDGDLLRRWGVRADTIHLIPGAGANLRQFHPQPRPSGPPIVMLASRMLWDKGVGEFVEAARRLRAEGHKARFVLVGRLDPDNPAAVSESEIRKWESNDVVEWWGYREDMPSVLNAACIVCLPSRYREGVPKILLEAMACGCPVVTTDMPGCRDVVLDGENGLIIPARDPTALATAIARLLSDGPLQQEMGVKARLHAELNFCQEKLNARTLDIYRRALHRACV